MPSANPTGIVMDRLMGRWLENRCHCKQHDVIRERSEWGTRLEPQTAHPEADSIPDVWAYLLHTYLNLSQGRSYESDRHNTSIVSWPETKFHHVSLRAEDQFFKALTISGAGPKTFLSNLTHLRTDRALKTGIISNVFTCLCTSSQNLQSSWRRSSELTLIKTVGPRLFAKTVTRFVWN